MKIKLISINSKFIHSSLALASLARMYGVYSARYALPVPKLEMVECTVNETFDSLAYSAASGADVYAFSVYIWNVATVERLCRLIKCVQPNAIIILGGPEVSYGRGIEAEFCDYIISGEGERAFFALACELCGLEIPAEFGYVADGKIRSCEAVKSLDEFQLAYDEKNLAELSDKIIYYESSRGCPFSCAYCLSSVCGRVRTLSLERVFSDIDFFVSNNVPQVKFVDRTFNCDRKRARKIWRYIIEKSETCRTNFHFEIGADLLTDEDVDLLAAAPKGRIQFEAGIQSTNEKTLDACCRHTDLAVLFKNIEALKNKGNINIHVDLIAGLPYETAEIFARSFNDAYSLGAHQLQLGFLKLLNGAPLNNFVQEFGYVFSPYPPYEIVKNNFLSYDEIMRLKKFEDAFERFYNSGRFKRSLAELEKLFKTPYEMFEKITEEFEKNGLVFIAVSTKKLFDFLSEFSKNFGVNIDEILLLDFITSERSEALPSQLRYLSAKPTVKLSEISAAHGNKKMQIKMIKNTAYVVDYSERDCVDGSFKIAEVIENAGV